MNDFINNCFPSINQKKEKNEKKKYTNHFGSYCLFNFIVALNNNNNNGNSSSSFFSFDWFRVVISSKISSSNRWINKIKGSKHTAFGIFRCVGIWTSARLKFLVLYFDLVWFRYVLFSFVFFLILFLILHLICF